ncbi:Uncharacterised protein [Klebsiella pneumoniae]|nr:Uncharacterised protein [Klebsiella pneumoniae]SSM98889.1 Uncharacterised protein [Klebsiella pneumoniae]SWK81771.1 Uncharacterised protein [Klebsiella pneumoniae]SXH71464.1 Uncharacterised protein [Klebsiella pneumoniae]
MKVTEPGLNTLIDNLNTLICEDSLLTRQEREDLVRAVAAIGAMKARVGMKKGEAPAVARREKREKKDRQPDPRFPRAGHPWQEDEKTLLSDALDSVPDEEIGRHLFWLSEKLGRTPFSVAFQIAAIRELNGWLTIIMSEPIREKCAVAGRRWKRYLMESTSGLRKI